MRFSSLLVFPVMLFAASCGRAPLSDESLKIDVSKLATPCECNDALIAVMKEDNVVLTELLSASSHEDSVWCNDEHMKRENKVMELHTHCRPIYDAAGGLGDCDNLEEGEKLDKEHSDLMRKTGLWR